MVRRIIMLVTGARNTGHVRNIRILVKLMIRAIRQHDDELLREVYGSYMRMIQADRRWGDT